MNMSVSSAVTKDGKQKIYVLFQEEGRQAECALPEFEVVRSHGFTDEELQQLIGYMKKEEETIRAQATTVNVMSAFMGKKK